MEGASWSYREKHRRFVSAVLVGALVALLFAAYQLTGSFSFRTPQHGGWITFFQLPGAAGRTRDWVENALLMLPAGVLIALYCTVTEMYAGRALLWVLMPVATVALCMEGLQWWMPERTASIWDALFMVVGGSLGGTIGRPLGAYLRATDRPRWVAAQGWGYWLAWLWVASAWVPTQLELHARFLVTSMPGWHAAGAIVGAWPAVVWTAVCWLVVLQLMQPQRPLPRLALLLPLTWAGLLLAPGRTLSWATILGACLALAIVTSRHVWRSTPRYMWLSLLIIAISIKALGYAPPSTHMGLHGGLPVGFHSLSGAILPATSLWIESYFLVVAVPWLITQQLPSPSDSIRPVVAAAGGLLVLALVKATMLGGHFQTTGLVLFALSTFAAYRWPAPLHRPTVPTPATSTPRWIPHGWPDPQQEVVHRPKRKPLLSAIGGIMAIALVLGVLLRLPQVPYNVRDLFVTRNVIVGLLLFASFLLWSGGAPLVAARFLVTRPLLHLAQPLFFLGMAIPSWLLLRYAVSAESLADILGSPVLGWPSDWEFFVRYLAFSAPFLLWLLYWDLLFEGAATHSRLLGGVHLAVALLLGAPLLWLAKLGVVDLAATDNIVELIADSAAAHAIFALWLVIGILTLNGVAAGWSVAESNVSRLVVAVATPVLGAASGWLLHVGTTPKAIQFLLGPSHTSSLTPLEIGARWSVVHFAGVCVIAWAQMVARQISLSGFGDTKALNAIPGN